MTQLIQHVSLAQEVQQVISHKKSLARGSIYLYQHPTFIVSNQMPPEGPAVDP